MAEAVRIDAPDLEAFIARAFVAVDVPPSEASIIAELMTRADVNGSEGHGVFRLPQYIRRIKGGAVNVRPHIRIEREAAGLLVRDLRAPKRLPGVERIWVPGEQSHAKRAERTRLGVPSPGPLLTSLKPARRGTADSTPHSKGLDAKCRISL